MGARSVSIEGSGIGEGEHHTPLRVVGIGASAGGLDEMQDLLRHVPWDSMAFVVVQHLAPHHDSSLVEILQRSSKIEVVTAQDNMRLEANRVHVIPPNVELAVLHGVLHLLPLTRRPDVRSSVDFFFRTLAADQGVAAIGIVLSGTGSDGTIGLEEIEDAGGITFVQDPGSAKYDGVPRSALVTGSADFCLTPEATGDELARIATIPLSVQLARTGGAVDAPFARIDLVSCRNLLIYLEPTAQRNVLRVLHYALNLDPAGYLVLGNSESIGGLPNLFLLVDRRSQVDLKKPTTSLFGLEARFGVPTGSATRTGSEPRPPALGLQATLDRKILELYGPPGVVIDDNLDIVQFRGRTGPFLDPAPGIASLNVLRVARLELHIELELAIESAQAEQRRVTSEVTFQVENEPRRAQLDVVPVLDCGRHSPCYAALFQTLPEPAFVATVAGAAAGEPLEVTRRRNARSERGGRQCTDATLKSSIESAAESGRLFRDARLHSVFPGPGNNLMKFSGNRIPASTDTPLVLLGIHDGRGTDRKSIR